MDALAIIARLGQGHLLEELADALQRTAEDCVETGQKGTVTLKLTVTSLAAVGALMTVLAGDGRRDRGLLAKRHEGTAHLRECNVGMWLVAGDSLRGGQPCSQRCQAAHEALRLGAVFLQALIDEYGDTPVTEQLRMLEAV